MSKEGVRVLVQDCDRRVFGIGEFVKVGSSFLLGNTQTVDVCGSCVLSIRSTRQLLMELVVLNALYICNRLCIRVFIFVHI